MIRTRTMLLPLCLVACAGCSHHDVGGRDRPAAGPDPAAHDGHHQSPHAEEGPTAHAGHGGQVPALSAGRLRVLHDPARDEVVARLGPYSLPGTGSTIRMTPAEGFAVPVDGWVTSFRARIRDEAGTELPDRLLHHINVVRPVRRELFMPVMQRLAAAGRETGEIRLPFPFGVPVSKGDTLVIAAMVHNPTGRPLTIFLEASFRYDTPTWLNRTAVQPFYLDVRPPPGPASFDLPPGDSELVWQGSPAVDARLLALGAHMHELARELRLEEVRPDGTTRLLWRARPKLAEDGSVASIPRKTFLIGRGRVLRRDRTYRITGVYRNPTDTVIRAGGMAEIGGIVIPLESWPEADRMDADFRADCRTFMRTNPELRERLCPSAQHRGH